MGLRPAVLDDLGLAPAIEWQAREFSKRYDIPVNVQIALPIQPLTDDQKTNIYRIVQEALTNCARHAKAKSIGIDVHDGHGSLTVQIKDNGIGLPPDLPQACGLGLIGIQERARNLGGRLVVDSLPGAGTTLAVTIPLNV